jgi:hypothetical protein
MRDLFRTSRGSIPLGRSPAHRTYAPNGRSAHTRSMACALNEARRIWRHYLPQQNRNGRWRHREFKTSIGVLPWRRRCQEYSQYTVKALFFDVLGTPVDWRTGVAREAEAHLKPRGYEIDWLAFADAWHAGYNPAMEEVRSGRIPFPNLTFCIAGYSIASCRALPIEDLPEDVLRSLNLAWHRLDAWADVSSSFAKLEGRFLLAPVSNANISLMTDIDRRNHPCFDAILGAEIAGDYKQSHASIWLQLRR